MQATGDSAGFTGTNFNEDEKEEVSVFHVS